MRRSIWIILIAALLAGVSPAFAAVAAATAGWREQVLAIIAHPDIAFILLLVGVYGLAVEAFTPGVFFPGVLGAICLVLAFIALTVLPVQYGALGLVILGIALMLAEAFTPGIGALGVGGLIAFVAGTLFLYGPSPSGADMRVSIPVLVGAAISCAGLSFFVLGAALRARSQPPVTGAEEMIGSRGVVTEWKGESGLVRVHGEIWSARAASAPQVGETVRVTAREGLILTVEPQ